MRRRNIKHRIIEKLDVGNGSGCWEFTGSIDSGGYGRIKADGQRKLVSVHRAMWEIAVSEIPPGMCVLHHCDNRKCVRPDHLFLGTYQVNSDDKFNKGRQADVAGICNPNSKLSEADVLFIRESNMPRKELGKHFGIGQTQVYRIKRRESWKNL